MMDDQAARLESLEIIYQINRICSPFAQTLINLISL